MNKPIIVGIDPGINTGYAILNLDGDLLAAGCEKEAGFDKVVSIVSKVGVPVLVAADTNPPSHFVLKVAARLNVRVFCPKESMPKLEKREMGEEVYDIHARDAYAAAIKAYRRYQNTLRQIGKRQDLSEERRTEMRINIVRGERREKPKMVVLSKYWCFKQKRKI